MDGGFAFGAFMFPLKITVFLLFEFCANIFRQLHDEQSESSSFYMPKNEAFTFFNDASTLSLIYAHASELINSIFPSTA
jgi:hypothetical protein